MRFNKILNISPDELVRKGYFWRGLLFQSVVSLLFLFQQSRIILSSFCGKKLTKIELAERSGAILERIAMDKENKTIP